MHILVYRVGFSAEYIEDRMSRGDRRWHVERYIKALEDEAKAIEAAKSAKE